MLVLHCHTRKLCEEHVPNTDEIQLRLIMTFKNEEIVKIKKFLADKQIQADVNDLEVEKPIGYEVENGIRSRERVVDLAEVFTPDWLVQEMMESFPESVNLPESRSLEPSCGNGNFLVEIVASKLQKINVNKGVNDACFQSFKCLSSTYGVDISRSNVIEARSRLSELTFDFLRKYKVAPLDSNFSQIIDYVLVKNIIHADFLKDAESVEITEFTFPKPYYVSQRIFSLLELFEINSESYVFPRPTRILPTTYYLDLK